MKLNFINTLRTAINTYKANRVKDVVNQYIGYCDAQLVLTLPAAMEFYRRSANVVVDKTHNNPAPALALADALEQCVKHYGPALKIEWVTMTNDLESRGKSRILSARLEQLMDALTELKTDVHAQPTP